MWRREDGIDAMRWPTSQPSAEIAVNGSQLSSQTKATVALKNTDGLL